MRAALTFEAGGDPAPLPAMLDALDSAGARATFFVDGRWAASHEPLLKALAAGHELGNHGYDHRDWTTLADDEVDADLRATEDLVRHVTGSSVKPWARPPYGALDARVLALLERAGYRAFYRHAVDGGHWSEPATPANVLTRALRSVDQEATVVLHTNSSASAAALPDLIAALRGRGVTLVGLSNLGSPPSPQPPREPTAARRR